MDNVKWDLAADLTRVIGDVPAHSIAKVARTASQGLRQFVGARMGGKAAATATEANTASTVPVASMPGGDYTQP